MYLHGADYLPKPDCRSALREYMRNLVERYDGDGHPRFTEVNAWYWALQAAQVVKICMVALHAGSQKLMVGWAVDAQHPLAVSTLSHHGLYSATFHQLWPAASTNDLTIRKLDGLQTIERLRTAAGTYVYRCQRRNGGPVYVAFCDDHVGQNHDQPTGVGTAAFPIAGPVARITSIITKLDQTEPQVRDVSVHGDKLRLVLTEYPVFIETMLP